MLNVHDLSFSYGNELLFSGIGFEVKKGTLCALFGSNGAGKSTLFKCCLKLLQPNHGSIQINGRNIATIATSVFAREASFVPQDHVPPFPFLVEEVVLMGRAPHFGGVFGITEKDKKIAEDAMRNLGILHLAHRAYTRLSGGQRQLTLIARALAQDTPLILLDEPTASLDFKNQLLIWKIIRDITDSGKTVFVCVHDPNHVSWFCDEVIVMHQKRLVASGKASAILTKSLLLELYGEVCALSSIDGLPVIYPSEQYIHS